VIILQTSQGYSKYIPFRSGTLLGTVAALCVVLLLTPAVAHAWMFCWNSKATGIENCWGYPPHSYLVGDGPRTIVTLNGTLVNVGRKIPGSVEVKFPTRCNR
jgi:hypothetical protein